MLSFDGRKEFRWFRRREERDYVERLRVEDEYEGNLL